MKKEKESMRKGEKEKERREKGRYFYFVGVKIGGT